MAKFTTVNGFEAAFTSYTTALQAKWDADAAGKGRHYVRHVVTEEGQRYVRIIQVVSGGQRSAVAFVDKTTGRTFPSASWKAPAKHSDGNIFNVKF